MKYATCLTLLFYPTIMFLTIKIPKFTVVWYMYQGLQDKQLLAITISKKKWHLCKWATTVHAHRSSQAAYLPSKISFLYGSIKSTPRCCHTHLVSNQYVGFSIMDTSQHTQDDVQRSLSLLGSKEQNLLWQVRPISMLGSFSLSCTRKIMEEVWEEWRGERGAQVNSALASKSSQRYRRLGNFQAKIVHVKIFLR